MVSVCIVCEFVSGEGTLAPAQRHRHAEAQHEALPGILEEEVVEHIFFGIIRVHLLDSREAGLQDIPPRRCD